MQDHLWIYLYSARVLPRRCKRGVAWLTTWFFAQASQWAIDLELYSLLYSSFKTARKIVKTSNSREMFSRMWLLLFFLVFWPLNLFWQGHGNKMLYIHVQHLKNSASYWNEQNWKVWITVGSRWSVLLPPCTKVKFWNICLQYHLFWQLVGLSGTEAVEQAVTAGLTSQGCSSWVSIFLGWGCDVICDWELGARSGSCLRISGVNVLHSVQKRKMNPYLQKSLEWARECKTSCEEELCVYFADPKKLEGGYMLEIGKQAHFWWLLHWCVSSVGIFSTWLLKCLGKVFCNTAEKCSSSAPGVWL